jgi:glycogen synthase
MLTDHELRDRLVTQAGERVLRFDWSDIARQTAAVYAEVAPPVAHRAAR